MAVQAQPRPMSLDEYLELERASDVRHEYLAGHVHAMAGASEEHNTIALNIASELRAQLRGRDCRVFMSDMKLRVAAADTFYYPDVFVTCDPADKERYFKERPCLIVEVLSPRTKATDQREKKLVYGQLESLRDYVLVDQDARRVEHLHRDSPDAPWTSTVVTGGDDVRLDALGVTLPLAEVYLGVK